MRILSAKLAYKWLYQYRNCLLEIQKQKTIKKTFQILTDHIKPWVRPYWIYSASISSQYMESRLLSVVLSKENISCGLKANFKIVVEDKHIFSLK